MLQSLALHDELELSERDGPFTLTCDEPSVPADATNLVWRAAVRLGRALDLSLDGLALTLRKRIPAQAGLGGGSADAAATLRLLARRWGSAPGDPRLAGVAAELGADVPFFLAGGTARATGRGDLIHPLADLPERHVLLVQPPFGVSTRDAYAWFDASPIPPCEDPPQWPTGAGSVWSGLLPRLRNDLEAVVTARQPEIGAAVEALRAAGALLAIMAGSGSAVAGFFGTSAEAERACRSLESIAERQRWRLLRTKTIDRQTYAASIRPRPSP